MKRKDVPFACRPGLGGRPRSAPDAVKGSSTGPVRHFPERGNRLLTPLSLWLFLLEKRFSKHRSATKVSLAVLERDETG